MKYLKIQNDGELDIRLIALMGGTTKANDAYKIGQFGTGLKYTLAYLYRNNLDFKIFVGTEEVKLHIEIEEIRGEQFEIICINGHRTSITTRMGMEWEAWMIIRELWCNALDEGGAVKAEVEQCEGAEGKTTFYIQVSESIAQVIKDWTNYFIEATEEVIFSNNNFKLYPPSDSLRLYKNGVLIYENNNIKSVFSYDILNAQINELRQYQQTPSYDVSQALKEMKAEGINFFLANISPDCFEASMDYDWFNSWGGDWPTVMTSIKIMTPSIRERFDDYGHSYSYDYREIPERLYNSLNKQFHVGDSISVNDRVNEFFAVGDPETEQKVFVALETLEACGYSIAKGLSIKVGFYSEKQNNKITMQNKSIYIPTRTDISQDELINQLVKCNEVFKHNVPEGRILEHFIKKYTSTILEKNQVEI